MKQKNVVKKTLLMVCVILYSANTYSQINPWTKTTNAKNINSNTLNSNYKINTSLLNKISTSETILFPDETNLFKEYQITETNILPKNLANKYPEIKSFIGIGTKGSKETIRFNYSPKTGISGLIHRPGKETLLIKPDKKGVIHQFYKFNTQIKDNKYECETIETIKTQFQKKNNSQINFSNGLRTFRLAVAASSEYSNFFLDGTEATEHDKKVKVLIAILNTVIRLNDIFERDFGLTMTLVESNDLIIYLNSGENPFGGTPNNNVLLQENLDNIVGSENYDIGHLFHKENSAYGNAGCIACTCTHGQKGKAYSVHYDPSSDDMNLLAAHEMGHQLGAYHVQSSVNCRSGYNSEVEPGSGSTIMSYAGICSSNVQSTSDDYFNYVDIRDVKEWTINNSSCSTLTTTNNEQRTTNGRWWTGLLYSYIHTICLRSYCK